MANTKSSKKVEKHECSTCAKCDGSCGASTAFPICFLVCVMTAVLVALIFAISFTVIFDYELKHKYGAKFDGQFALELSEMREGEMLELEAGALIDFYESNQTGFIYASSDDCTSCYNFKERLTTIAEEYNVLANVHHYNYPRENEPSIYDDYAEEITLNGEQAPVLLYIRDGKIYDRLDEINGEAGISAFIGKYK